MAKSVKKNAGAAFHCPLCERSGDFLKPSKHHLVPKSRDGEVTADICADCHRQIHALFTLVELERDYSTVEALKASRPCRSGSNGRQSKAAGAWLCEQAMRNEIVIRKIRFMAQSSGYDVDLIVIAAGRAAIRRPFMRPKWAQASCALTLTTPAGRA